MKRELSSVPKDTQDSPTQERRESLSILELLPGVTLNPGQTYRSCSLHPTGSPDGDPGSSSWTLFMWIAITYN